MKSLDIFSSIKWKAIFIEIFTFLIYLNIFFTGAFGKSPQEPKTGIPYAIHSMFKKAAEVQEPAPIPITPINDNC